MTVAVVVVVVDAMATRGAGLWGGAMQGSVKKVLCGCASPSDFLATIDALLVWWVCKRRSQTTPYQKGESIGRSVDQLG